jgi:large subunit ribosomal protein L10
MKRQEKEEQVADIQGLLANVHTAVIAEYKGLTVSELNALRRELREVAGEYRVAKNTLMALALEGTPYLSLKDLLKGQNGLVLGRGEAVDLAKVVTRYASGNGKFIIKGGVTEGQFLDSSQMETLAKLPSRDALRAQLLGLLSQPATQLVGVLAAPASQLARVLDARREQGGGQSTSDTSDTSDAPDV